MSSPCDDAVAQVAKLNNHYSNTSVFGVGDGSSSSCLDKLALYGGLTTAAHIVKTPNDLASTLGTVIDTIASEACTIEIHSSQAPDPKTVEVLFDGIPVPMDPSNGWTFDDGTTTVLTVHGSYCHALEQTVGHIEVVSGCAPPHN